MSSALCSVGLSTLPFPGTQEQYEVFIQELVRNLYGEGNDVFREGEWARSVELYSEALNIAEYADSEEISIACEMREKLHANRAASYLNIGLHDQALEDCEKALQLNDSNYRALYRKARSLKELGRHQEAYEAVAKCSMTVPQDASVIQLTQELAKMLGLKIRKAYVRDELRSGQGVGASLPVSIPACPPVTEVVDVESLPAPVNMMPTVPPAEPGNPEAVPVAVHVPQVNGSRSNEPYPAPQPLDFGAEIIGDDLDELLDSVTPAEPSMVQFQTDMKLSIPAVQPMGTSERNAPSISAMGMVFGVPDGSNYTQDRLQQVDLAKNPLADTHEFKQACSTCYIKTGPGVLNYAHHPEEHKCKKDLLLGRIKHAEHPTWKLIRPRPTKNQYEGPYYICKDVASGEDCKYLGHCTFAYCQEEIDVWTLERKGFISRDLLCDPYGARMKISLTVAKILQEHHGIFMFLCQVCFDHKPRIISKTNKDDPSLCSHPVTKHQFEGNKCLVHVVKDNTVRYSKIRPYHQQFQLDLCRHAVRYGCQREDFCFYAHTLIELKVWMMQREQGITHESIVQEAKKYWNTEATSQKVFCFIGFMFGPPNLKMQFVCGHCWRNGQVSEPDKNKKYCSAKARHPWSKDRQVVLVSSVERKKWTTVRPLPTRKPAPSQFEICMHVAAGKKCQYIGNCTFAHSTEEKDLWTYMKENNIADMEQLYELWLQSQKPGWSEENSSTAGKENGKQIHMPTDYAEEVAGNHCWLCGKNCNSEKQWQQHITSEKHKERVFNSEDDQNCWQYRFPTGTFKVCERFRKGTCKEGELCKLAHGEEELKEWQDRREFLLMKLAKARNDHLIAPNDNDFGKYSFLLKDIK
uniref:C3H1-type domain-containing protein n=1 Tax=Electrophorus electricus TaxID=8005 RepID=A0A4W4DQE2_ELEEL